MKTARETRHELMAIVGKMPEMERERTLMESVKLSAATAGEDECQKIGRMIWALEMASVFDQDLTVSGNQRN